MDLKNIDILHEKVLQGDPNQNLRLQTAITLKLGSSDPMLIMRLRGGSFCFNFWKFVYIFSCLFTIFHKKKPAAAFWLYQKSLVSEL